MKNKYSILMLLFIFLIYNPLIAQQLSFDYPSDNNTDLSIYPTLQISIIQPYLLDYSSINQTGYEVKPVYDSLNERLTVSLIYLFEQDEYDGSDSSLIFACRSGSICSATISNGNILLSPDQLKHSTTYGMAIFGLRLYETSQMDTIVIDTVYENYFTTCKPMYEVVGTSYDETKFLHRHDPVTIYFNRKLLSTSTNSGDIITMETVSDPPVQVSGTAFLTADSLGISFLPDSGFTYYTDYKLNIHTSKLTGDEKSDQSIYVFARKYAEIMINNKIMDINDSLPLNCGPPELGKLIILGVNESRTFTTPNYVGDYFFVGWECLDDSTYQGLNNNKLVVSFTDSNIKNLNFNAIYAHTPKDTVFFEFNSSYGNIDILTSGQSIGSNTYTLPRKSLDYMYITARPDSGYIFSYWSSNDPDLNGSTEQSIEVNGFINYNNESQLNSRKKESSLAFNSNIYNQQFNAANIKLNPVFIPENPLNISDLRVTVIVDYENLAEGKSWPQNYIKKANELFSQNMVCTISDGTTAILTLSGQTSLKGEINFTHSGSIDVNLTGYILTPNEDEWEISYYKCNRGAFSDGKVEKGRRVTADPSNLEWPYGVLPPGNGINFDESFSYENGEKYDIVIVIQRKKMVVKAALQLEDNESFNPNEISIEKKEGLYLKYYNKRSGKITKDILNNNDEVIKRTYYYLVFKGWDFKLFPSVKNGNDVEFTNIGWQCNYNGVEYDCDNTGNSDYILTASTSKDLSNSLFITSTDFRLLCIGTIKKKIMGNNGTFETGQDNYEFEYIDLTENSLDKLKKELKRRYNAGMYEETDRRGEDLYIYKTTIVKFIFNKVVDINSINSTNLFAIDGMVRCDAFGKQNYEANINSNVKSDPTGRIIYFTLVNDNDISPTHKMDVDLHIKKSIKSLYSDSKLRRDIDFTLSTELPGVLINIKQYNVLRTQDPYYTDEPHLFYHIACSNGKNAYSHSSFFDKGDHLPLSADYWEYIHPLDIIPINYQAYYCQRIEPNSIIDLAYQAWEFDDYEIVEAALDITNAVITYLDIVAPNSWTIASKLLKEGQKYIKNDGFFSFMDDVDESLGGNELRLNSNNNWSSKCYVNGEINSEFYIWKTITIKGEKDYGELVFEIKFE